MVLFESILAYLLGAVLLAALARRMGVAYPVMLAVAGAALAFVPNVPQIPLDPDLVLVLFVAPILLDAGFDTSVRDLRRNWRCIGGLVVVAVGLTTVAVACVTRWLVPEIPWAAAIALGAIVAPPDAVAATAILRRVRPPHRLIVILEGESLLNDATALLIYRLAVAAVAAGSFSPVDALPTFGLVVFGSVALGGCLGWLVVRLLARFEDAPSLIILQFITTFGVWILSERLHLSGIITIVVYAMVLAWSVPAMTSARLRIPMYAVWETAIFVLQIFAFILVGLQLRPIFGNLDAATIAKYGVVAVAVLVTTIVVRLVWVFFDHRVASFSLPHDAPRDDLQPDVTSRSDGIIIAWCGMRGIVTLAAAYALPVHFPYRDLILICAFGVVVGTLVVQGLTLPLLLHHLPIEDHHPIEREFRTARRQALEAAMGAIAEHRTGAAGMVQAEYAEMLQQSLEEETADTEQNRLRRKALAVARDKALEMRRAGEIGDNAFHKLEEELDWLELGAVARSSA
ncbi:MAG TPA: sodium:proton antiporter [Bosea sp. (in: a-proteobacteria)]|jgi:CPA1 family monovalent cation:H+ antiporter|uniref:cation:proton antiporter n=1 Tax=Bosea sp. (in: a-proteobacteria) TaxID=1871050 RepID=UPI002E0F38A1|nr:sodium:proton antiporter [Bosea sp. (in: a-proteobacteria)]